MAQRPDSTVSGQVGDAGVRMATDSSGSVGTDRGLSGVRVLIADDNPLLLEPAHAALHSAGAEVLYRYAVITDSVEGLVLVDIDTMANGEFRDNKLTRALTWNPDNVLKGARHVTLAGNYAYITTDAGLVGTGVGCVHLPQGEAHAARCRSRALEGDAQG